MNIRQEFVTKVLQDFDSPTNPGNYVPSDYNEYKKFWTNVLKIETIHVLKDALKSRKYIMVSLI